MQGPSPAHFSPKNIIFAISILPFVCGKSTKKQPLITPARVGISAVILIVSWILFQYVILADTMPVLFRILALCFYGIVFLVICFRFKNQ